MEQNTATHDYSALLNSIYIAMGRQGKADAISKLGSGIDNLEHTWEAYHFTSFINEMFIFKHPRLMKEFKHLLLGLEIGSYGDFRKLPSGQGFTLERAEALFKGVVNIRCTKDSKFTECNLLLEFLLFCQQPFVNKDKTVTKARIMSIFYGKLSNSDTLSNQSNPELIKKAQLRLSEEIERLNNGADALLEGGGRFTHPVFSTLTKEQIAIVREVIKLLPEIFQEELLDKISKQKIQITELESLVTELQKKINEFQSSEYITDEIKLLVKNEKINEAKVRLTQTIEATVKKQQQKHGEYYYQLGKIEELQLNFKEAYEAFKQAVNCQPDNIEYLNSAGLFGNKIADYEQVQYFLNKSLELTTNKYGEDHPDIATCYNNLASNLKARGKYDEAESLYQKSLDIRQRVLGEGHPHTASSYNNLASNLNAQGKYDAAEFLYRIGLDINRRVFGEDHPDTVTSYSNLAFNLYTQGKYNEAEPLCRKSLDIRQRVLRKNHPDIATSYNNLASNLNAQGKYDEAEPLCRKSLDINKRVFGEDHPDTVTSYSNLAFNLDDQEKYIEAEPLYRKGLNFYQRVLGEGHPHTASSYNNLASNLNAQGRHDEAESLYRKSYKLLLKIFGEHHPTTRTVLSNWQKNKS